MQIFVDKLTKLNYSVVVVLNNTFKGELNANIY